MICSFHSLFQANGRARKKNSQRTRSTLVRVSGEIELSGFYSDSTVYADITVRLRTIPYFSFESSVEREKYFQFPPASVVAQRKERRPLEVDISVFFLLLTYWSTLSERQRMRRWSLCKSITGIVTALPFSPSRYVGLHKKDFTIMKSLKSRHQQSFFCTFLVSLPLLFFVQSRFEWNRLKNSPKFSAKSHSEQKHPTAIFCKISVRRSKYNDRSIHVIFSKLIYM